MLAVSYHVIEKRQTFPRLLKPTSLHFFFGKCHVSVFILSPNFPSYCCVIPFSKIMRVKLMKLIFSLCYPYLKVQSCKLKKALINDHLHVSKVSWEFRITTIYNFAVIYPWNLLFSQKVAYFLTVSVVFSVYKQKFTPQ